MDTPTNLLSAQIVKINIKQLKIILQKNKTKYRKKNVHI